MGSGPEAVINYKGFTTKYLQPAFPHITFDSVKISGLFSKMSQNCSEFLIQLQIHWNEMKDLRYFHLLPASYTSVEVFRENYTVCFWTWMQLKNHCNHEINQLIKNGIRKQSR